MTTSARYRRSPGEHWRPAHLRCVIRVPGPRVYIVELVDETTGNTRTLRTPRWLIQARTGGNQWVALDVWADGTGELFTTT